MGAVDVVVAGVGALFVLFGISFGILLANNALNFFRRELYLSQMKLPRSRMSLSSTARLVVRETCAVIFILAWRVTRRRRAAIIGDGPRVVLVHGLWADGTCMSALADDLVKRGRSAQAPSLGRCRSIGAWAHALARELCAAPGGVDVVCHSLGGIALRLCLAEQPALRARVRRVVTVATPDEGTGAAVGVPLDVARQLVPHSPFLSMLPSLDELVPHAELIRFASRHDPVVYPPPRHAILLDDVGHAELIVAPRLRARIVDAVASS